MFSAKKILQSKYVIDMLVNLMESFPTVQISNNHIVYFKYLAILFVYYISIKLKIVGVNPHFNNILDKWEKNTLILIALIYYFLSFVIWLILGVGKEPPLQSYCSHVLSLVVFFNLQSLCMGGCQATCLFAGHSFS